MGIDVFEEAETGVIAINCVHKSRPKMPRIMFAAALAGATEGLTIVNDASVGDVGFVSADCDVVYGCLSSGVVL